MLNLLRKRFIALQEELASYAHPQRMFIFFAILCGFLICCDYSIIRPISSSLFIHHFSTDLLPYVWVAGVPLNFLFVSLYNRLIPRWGSKKIFLVLLGSVIVLNFLFALFSRQIPSLSFLFYIWKEIYVMMMFQLLWSLIHTNISMDKAKYLYGFIFGIGGLGSMVGSTFPGFFAVSYGSENLIFLTVPVYFLLFLSYWRMNHYSRGEVPTPKEKEGGFLHGLQLISRSRFLIFALLIVVFMQMITAIVDFQFNAFLEKNFREKDLITEYSGRIFGIVHSFTMLFQFIGSYLVINWIGFKRSHYFIPSLLAISLSMIIAFPFFSVVCFTFIACKSLDFSMFGVIKEMLYVPLKPDEKFRAKAVIDVFAYRSSKAFVSLIILSMTRFAYTHLLPWVSLILALLWIGSVAFGLKEFEKIQKIEKA